MNLDKKSSKILIVDDNPVNIDFLVELLKEYDARTVLDGISALEAVEEERPDVILLDISMPGMDGFEVCQKLKESPKSRDIPVIFLSASHDTESIVRAFDVGGVDYISKPYNTQEVLIRLQTQLKLKKALELLEQRSLYDDLTGVPNRKKFFQDAQRWMKRSQAGIPLHLYILSIENFIDLNDKYGYEVGDQVIKAIALIVKKLVKANYVLSRFGGSEFFLVFNGIEKAEADRWVSAIKSGSQKVQFKQIPDLKFSIITSSSSSEKTDTSINQIIRRAHMN